MIEISETWIDSQAPNSAAIKNGHDLIKKGEFTTLHHSDDQQVLFGTCAGSGKTPYVPSVDFVIPDKPVMRCSCPSRQIPCKHVLGLLYAAGQGFDEGWYPLLCLYSCAAAAVGGRCVKRTGSAGAGQEAGDEGNLRKCLF